MGTHLRTKNVFVDTEAFDSASYHFAKGDLKHLLDRITQGQLSLHTTSITVREMEEHIRLGVHAAKSALKQFRSDARVLYNSKTCSSFFGKVDFSLVEEELLDQLNEFLSKTQANVIDLVSTKPGSVFERYFDRKAPFDEGKNKSEFPDAFSLEALRSWADLAAQDIYVVTKDKAFKDGCSISTRLIPLSTLQELFELIILEEENQRLVELAMTCFKTLTPKIEEAIANEFCMLGFWLEDQDGDVDDVSVSSTSIVDSHIIEVTEEDALFRAIAQVEFKAEVVYDDLDTASWDSEDKQLYIHDRINTTLNRDEEVQVEVHITFDEKGGSPTIEHLQLLEDRDIAVVVDDQYPYK
jgi:hypothetical protein